MRFITVLVTVFLAVPVHIHAQTAPRLNVRAGADFLTSMTYRNSFSQTELVSGNAELTWKAIGKDAFERAWNLPELGVGVEWTDQSALVEGEERKFFKDLYAVYGVIRRDLNRRGRVNLGYDFGLGAAYTSGVFDYDSCPENWYYGSHLTCYVRAAAHVGVMVTPYLEILAEAKAAHASNGRLSYPNYGGNFLGGGLSARYSFYTSEHHVPRQRIPRDVYRHGLAADIQVGGGVHTCGTEYVARYISLKEPYAGLKRWPKASLSADLMYRYSGKFSSGIIADLFYSSNASALRDYDTAISGTEAVAACPGYSALSLGVGFIHGIHYKNWMAFVSSGVYLYRRMGIRDYHGPVYNRAGLRYHPAGHPLYVGASIKAQPFKAEYFDFSLGWTI